VDFLSRFQLFGLPLGFWVARQGSLDQLQVDLGFAEYTNPFTGKSQLDVFCITTALMFGTAGLPHVIVRFNTVWSVRAARYSAGRALLFIALLYTAAPAPAVFARYNLIRSLHGATVESVIRPDAAALAPRVIALVAAGGLAALLSTMGRGLAPPPFGPHAASFLTPARRGQ
jgi:cation/acetate symporter